MSEGVVTPGAEVQLAAIASIGRALDQEAIDYWLFGGWAVDFWVGRVTREHDDIDVAAWKQSIAVVRAWEPVALGLTHFGEAGPEQLDRALEALDEQVAIEGSTDGEASFVAAMEQRVRAGCGEDADAMLAATPLDQLHMGLARWRTKFG